MKRLHIMTLMSWIQRAMKHGGDSRFDKVKHKPKEFSFYWFAQGSFLFLASRTIMLIECV